MSKVIQIAVAGIEGWTSDWPDQEFHPPQDILYALRDDGVIFVWNGDRDRWDPMPKVPTK